MCDVRSAGGEEGSDAAQRGWGWSKSPASLGPVDGAGLPACGVHKGHPRHTAMASFDSTSKEARQVTGLGKDGALEAQPRRVDPRRASASSAQKLRGIASNGGLPTDPSEGSSAQQAEKIDDSHYLEYIQ
ncbi:uncharacterized protein PSFLO_02894 [Pseudozyma flocculosa]|uniref:Uncharacterized protein n=1 Tax=Pseudozyma flocculosa TaxID=84751 RepID=A0A5C3F295_9BASI|nr:uncharacterized protein PSFLO_02894 [Pseudozyma flocculosa]